MKIATLNVNGLRASIKKGFLDWLENSGIDIICLQEVRMDAADLEKKVPKGWHNIHVAAQKKGYSGVAIWSKIKPKSWKKNFAFDLSDNEGRIIKAEFENCIVYSMYFPSGTSGTSRQDEKYRFLNFIEKNAPVFQQQHEHVLICGDVNIAHTALDIFHDKANAKNSGFLPRERDWMSSFLQSGWKDVYRECHPKKEIYSWWSNRSRTARSKNVGWRIDYHLASPALANKVQESSILEREIVLSDHTAVIVEYNI